MWCQCCHTCLRRRRRCELALPGCLIRRLRVFALPNDGEEICGEAPPPPPLAVSEDEGISPVFNAPMRARWVRASSTSAGLRLCLYTYARALFYLECARNAHVSSQY